MKIVLVSPPEQHLLMEAGDRPAMGLLYLKGAIEQSGHTAIISDLNLDSYDKLKEKLEDTDFIGMTTCIPYKNWIHNFSQHLKHNYPNKLLIAGGPMATVIPNELVYFDYVVRGEGEEAIVNIMEGKEQDRIIYKPYEKDLDNLPIPHNYSNYDYTMNQDGEKTAILLTSRSCPRNCCFCTKGILGDYRVHSADRVLQEIEGLIKKGYKSFYFIDDHFTANRNRAIDICNKIIEKNLNISFRCTSRTDCVDEELISLMKQAGLRSISFGLEHFDNNVLKNINKGETVETHLKAIKICKEFKIKIRGSFIVNLPGATKETILKTLNMAIDLDLDYADFYPLIAYPGTPIYENPNKFGVKITNEEAYQISNKSNVKTGLPRVGYFVDYCRNKWREHKQSLCPWESG